MTTGSVTLVGAGPGDPELLTLKAVRAIQQASVLLVDDLVSDDVVALAQPATRIVHVGKRGGCQSTPQSFILKLMVSEARNGERVVRLKGGDPFIFGRGGEEMDALSAAGIPCSIVPGITAATGCAAATGIPLTHRDHAQAITFVTAHRKEGDLALDWSLACRPHHTTVIYMGLSCLAEIATGLVENGLQPATPVAVIANGTTERQREITGTLADIARRVENDPLPSPALLIVGDVVAARGQLSVPDALTLDNEGQPGTGALQRPHQQRW